MPYWAGTILCAATLAFNAIAIIKTATTADIVTDIEERLNQNTTFIRSLTADAEGLLKSSTDEGAKSAIKKVYEAVRYSDPVSSTALAPLENEIDLKFSDLTDAVNQNEPDKIVCIANETIATCEYCGTQQTLPKLDDERRANLYDRANHFRRNNEFDKAMGIYEKILNEDNTDAEAYWSLVLCRYGIEYVEDPASHKRVPTVNRAQFTSIYDDDNYKSALQYADSLQRSIYEAEAATINEIQKGIYSI